MENFRLQGYRKYFFQSNRTNGFFYNSIITTDRYTHLANTTQRKIKSPLDNFDFVENDKNKPP